MNDEFEGEGRDDEEWEELSPEQWEELYLLALSPLDRLCRQHGLLAIDGVIVDNPN